MDFYELLKEDHRKVAQLLSSIQNAAAGSDEKQELFLETKRELELHSLVEETVVYPALEEAAKTAGLSFEAREEHRVISMLLDEMEALDTNDEIWAAKFKVLKEQIEHHVDEEENEIFPAARKVISAEEAEEMGAQIVTQKAIQRASTPETVTQED